MSFIVIFVVSSSCIPVHVSRTCSCDSTVSVHLLHLHGILVFPPEVVFNVQHSCSRFEDGRRGRCVKHWSRTPADPGSIPGAGDINKRLISLPCNIRRCAPRGSHIT